jgi:hypothetical protein
MITTVKKLAGAAIALGALSISTQASATPSGALIISEWNAVSANEMLDDCKDNPQEGDQFFGCVNGNGDNWIELVVTQNNLNIQGWTVSWKNNDSGGHPNNGSFTFSSNSLWSSLKAGTIITVHDNGDAGYTTGYSGNPCSDYNWWIDVDVLDTTYISSSSLKNGTTLIGPGFKTDNDCWRGMIADNASTTVQDWVGENNSCGSIPAAIWAGAGLGNLEVGKLEADPVGGTSDTNYKDGDSGTYGAPNVWSGAGSPQSLDALCNNACGGSNGCCGTPGDLSCYSANVFGYYY